MSDRTSPETGPERDLVNRLRWPESLPSTLDHPVSVKLRIEAADKIEKLRRNLRHWREECGKLHAKLSNFGHAPTPNLDGDGKLRLFLAILQSANGEASGNDDKWNWINYFCDDAEPLDTFNQASKRKLTRVTHDSDSDNSMVYLTDAGRAFIASPDTSTDRTNCGDHSCKDPNCAYGAGKSRCQRCGILCDHIYCVGCSDGADDLEHLDGMLDDRERE